MRTIPIMTLLLAVLGSSCGGDDDACSSASECIDGDVCTEDRCVNGSCSYVAIPDCCLADTDCNDASRPVCDPERNRCVECLEDADCGGDETCNPDSHTCEPVVECIEDTDCEDTDACTLDTCDNGSCSNHPLDGCPYPLGGRCENDAQCQIGTCLTESESGIPDGMCSKTCTSDADCGTMLGCSLTKTGRMCIPVCASSDDCRSGHLCLKNMYNSFGVCYPACRDSADCPQTGVCNPFRGTCTAAQGAGPNGAACTIDDDCMGICATERGTGFPGGFCTTYCAQDRAVCPNETICLSSWTASLGTVPMCYSRYNQAEGCREHYVPVIAWETGMDPHVACLPACTQDSCSAENPCDPWTGLCGPRWSTGDQETGTACEGTGVCKGACFSTLPGGYCSTPCSTDNPSCPGDDLCVSLEVTAVCMQSCSGDADCREAEGYHCVEGVCRHSP